MKEMHKNRHSNRFKRWALIPLCCASLLVMFSSGAKTGFAYTDIPRPGVKPSFQNVSLDQSAHMPQPVVKARLGNFMKRAVRETDRELDNTDILVPIKVAKIQQVEDAPLPLRKPLVKKVSPVRKKYSKKQLNISSKLGSDAALYKKIFMAQTLGDMAKADSLIADLKDRSLMSHILYQRYMHPNAYTSNFQELQAWLDQYQGHPGAKNIYDLAVRKRKSADQGDLKKPQRTIHSARMVEPTMQPAKKYKTTIARTTEQQRVVDGLKRTIRKHIRSGEPTQALTLLHTTSATEWMDHVERDKTRANIAASYYYAGKVTQAHDLATKAVNRSGAKAPLASWIAGLSAWRKGHYKTATNHFEMTANSPYVSGWMASAGAYWAARSHMRTGNVKQVSPWFEKARKYPRTFYGLAATRALGLPHDFNWDIGTFSTTDYKFLSQNAHGIRAMKLVEAQQYHLAAEELKSVPTKSPEQRKALMAYVNHAGLPSLALRLGGYFSSMDNTSYDAALYPEGSWLKPEEYKVEPELVHAIMRQESKFNPSAYNPSGASGLMQIIPSTASYVSGDESLKTAAGRHKLNDPKINLNIGQTYIQNLLSSKAVNGNLLNLLIAYNAGPGNLNKWKSRLSDVDDSLLFIESIPSSEARAYVERVIANYWIYKMRSGETLETLDAVAAGKAPYYSGFDQEPFSVVSKN